MKAKVNVNKTGKSFALDKHGTRQSTRYYKLCRFSGGDEEDLMKFRRHRQFIITQVIDFRMGKAKTKNKTRKTCLTRDNKIDSKLNVVFTSASSLLPYMTRLWSILWSRIINKSINTCCVRLARFVDLLSSWGDGPELDSDSHPINSVNQIVMPWVGGREKQER